MARTLVLTLRPSRTIGLSLNSSDQGCIGFAPQTQQAALEMMPFFKGDTGASSAGHCLMIPVTATAISDKQITLPAIPVSVVLLDVVGGTSQRQNVDFIVTGMVLSWAGLSLELLLAAGDYLSIYYT